MFISFSDSVIFYMCVDCTPQFLEQGICIKYGVNSDSATITKCRILNLPHLFKASLFCIHFSFVPQIYTMKQWYLIELKLLIPKAAQLLESQHEGFSISVILTF